MSDKPDWCRCGNFALLTQQADGRWYCGCIRCDAEVMADTSADALRQWSAMQALPQPPDDAR